jgi:hypothetical protein
VADGNEVVSIDLRVTAKQLQLSWRRFAGEASSGGASSGGKDSADTIIPIVIIPIVYGPCPLGGIRPYFLCPGNNAAGCERRVLKLYLVRRYFLCRFCGRLGYASKSEQPWQQAFRRANKLRQRLGIVGASVPEKPKDMPVSVYARLLEETLEAETRATEAGTARLQRLLAWIESRRKPLFTLD